MTDFDLSPTDGVADRRIYAGGVRIKVAPPLLPTPWRVWAFLGFGGAYVQMPRGPSFPGTSTSTAEVPVGVGLGRRLAGALEIYVELAGRLEIAGYIDLHVHRRCLACGILDDDADCARLTLSHQRRRYREHRWVSGVEAIRSRRQGALDHPSRHPDDSRDPLVVFDRHRQLIRHAGR